ncbi:Uncharacterised protein [Vibrio cholerae]|nr:Uncharacterised protein [Vibrio cholerae]
MVILLISIAFFCCQKRRSPICDPVLICGD